MPDLCGNKPRLANNWEQWLSWPKDPQMEWQNVGCSFFFSHFFSKHYGVYIHAYEV